MNHKDRIAIAQQRHKRLKAVLKRQKLSLAKFWLEHVADVCNVEFATFSNNMRGYVNVPRADILEIVDQYLEEHAE